MLPIFSRIRDVALPLALLLSVGMFNSACLAADSLVASAKIQRYAQRQMSKLDENDNDVIEGEEQKALGISADDVDQNKDGSISLEELTSYFVSYSQNRRLARRSTAQTPNSRPASTSPTNGQLGTGTDNATQAAQPSTARRNTRFLVKPQRLPSNVPAWFVSLDRDGDGQVSLHEFIHTGQRRNREFQKLDRNRDGLITAAESVATGKK